VNKLCLGGLSAASNPEKMPLMRQLLLIISLAAGLAAAAQPADTLVQQLERLLEQHHAPGAVVVWVQGDSAVLLQGLGWADLAQQRHVDAEQTLLRVGSISKPFTAIGVLHQVEQGKLSLDQDIRQFIGMPARLRYLEDGFPQAVTLRHLLTHTGGFDDRYIGKSARTRAEALPLGEAVETLMPKRFIASGELASYSNFGAALAGYLLEQVSGQSFAAAMRQEVFVPLGMNDSSFDPDREAQQQLMTGYYLDQGRLAPLAYDYLNDAPAGQMVATGRDMAVFIAAMLNPGGLEARGVLSAATTAEMLAIQHTHHPALHGGTGFLWNIAEQAGHPYVGHDGGYIGASARLMLFPEHQAGLFIAANTMDFGFISAATDLLLSAFLPSPPLPSPRPLQPRYDYSRPLSDFAGTWRHTRYSRYSFTKFAVLIGMMGGEMVTGTLGDSLLTMPTHTGERRRLRRVGPLLFQSLDDDYHLAFREEDGDITHVFTSGTSALERLHPLETRRVQIPLLAGSLTLFLLVALGYPLAALWRRRGGRRLSILARYEWVVAVCYALGFLLLGIAIALLPPYELLIGFGYGLPKAVYVSTLLPFVGLLCTVLLVYQIINRREVALSRRAWSATLVLVSVAYFAGCWYWRLAGVG
jgi:CubicO group peptidase (beta-lactamase class C family)